MGYRSGEFDTGLKMLPYPCANGIYTSGAGSQLWLVGSTYGPNGPQDMGWLIQTDFDTLSDLPLGDATNSSNWSTVDGGKGVGYLSIDGPSETISRSALVMSDTPFLFWNQVDFNYDPINPEFPWVGTPAGLLASNYQASGSSTEKWTKGVQLHGTDERHSQIMPYYSQAEYGATPYPQAEVSATPFGLTSILVACSSVTYTAPNCTSGDQNLYLGVFNTADNGNPTAGVWIPRYEYTWSISDLQKCISGIKAPGHNVSVDWFATGTNDATGPVFYLAMVLWPDIEPNPYSMCLYLRLTLDENNIPLLDDRYPDPVWDSFADSQPISIARDPAGRLRGYACDQQDQAIVTYTFSTAAPPDATKSGTGNALSMTKDTIPAPSADGVPPSVTFYVALDAPQNVSIQAQAMDGQQYTFTAQQYPVYEILFYGSANNVYQEDSLKGQISTYAYAQTVPGTYGLKPPTMNVITGIIDGPMPVANQNLLQDWSTTQAVPDLGDITYGTGKTQSVKHETQFEWSAGFKFEGEPAQGWGPAWDISFSGGTGKVSGNSQQTTTGTIMTGPSYFFYDQNNPLDPNNPPAMDVKGYVQCNQATINAQVYRFKTASGVGSVGKATGGPQPDGTVSVFARSTDAHLWHFLQVSQESPWEYDDLSWEVNNTDPLVIDGDPCFALNPNGQNYTQGHIYAHGTPGGTGESDPSHLYDFFVSPTSGKWTYTDLTQEVGCPPTAGTVVGGPWPDGNIGIYARAPMGGPAHTDRLLSIWWGTDIQHWEYDDLSWEVNRATPLTIAGDPVLVRTITGQNHVQDDIYVQGTDGHLYHFFNSGQWQFDDLSLKPNAPTITGNPIALAAGDIFVRGYGASSHEDGHLWWYNGTSWSDVSSSVNWQLIVEDPGGYLDGDTSGSTVQLFAQGTNGQLYGFEKKPDPAPWVLSNLSASASGGSMVAGSPYVPAEGGHIYICGTDTHLLDFASLSSGWQVTDIPTAGTGGIIYDATTANTDQAPKWVMLQASFSPQPAVLTYPVFSVAPGDLSSYTPYSWNQRMQALAKANPDQDLYSGSDYFNDVIVKNAAQLQDDSFLPLSWGEGGTAGTPQFQAVTSTYTENSWSIDNSVYVGWGFGGLPEGKTVSFFGNPSFRFMVGYTIHYQVTDTQTEEKSWGLNFTAGNVGTENTWGPPPYPDFSQHPGCATQYEFQLYFLPAPDGTKTLPDGTALTPNYWVKELQAGLQGKPVQEGNLDPSTIDTGSGAFKIVYVVVDYEIIPSLTLDPSQGAPGSSVSLAGIGFGTTFGVSDTVTLSLVDSSGKETPLGSVETDPNWNFGGTAFVPAATITIPNTAAAGSCTIKAIVGTDGPSQSVPFTVT